MNKNEIEKSQEKTPINHSDWYIALVEEIQAIKSEGLDEAKEILVKMKWRIGKAVRDEKKIYGLEKKLAEDIGISARNVRWCVQLYDKYPAVDWDRAYMKLPDYKNWTDLRNQLGDGEEEECMHEDVERIPRWRCKDCGRIFTEDPTLNKD